MADEQTTEEEFNVPDTEPISNPGGTLSVKLHSVRLDAKDVISHYSPEDWEELIERWVYKKYSPNSESESVEANGYRIEKLTGSGDQGVDIGVFKDTKNGKGDFNGEWYCYQAKRYKNKLTLSDVLPEIFKVIRHVTDGHYVAPKEYYFVASNGFTPKVKTLLGNSDDLKKRISDDIDKPAPYAKGCPKAYLEELKDTVDSMDFSIFKTMSRKHLISEEETTTFYITREQSELPKRYYNMKPGPALSADEDVYVRKLLDIYYENKSPTPSPFSLDDVPPNDQEHFQRQREYFYSAEDLRLYARESVPSGTYEKLQEDILAGVIETAEDNHDNGMKRLRAVQEKADLMPLDRHAILKSTIIPQDRRGICHQLANEDKLTWVK